MLACVGGRSAPMRLTYYQRLSTEGDGAGVGARAAARAYWAALRRAAARVARLYAARHRRWVAQKLWGGGRRRRVAAARTRGYEYDSASYKRNFDDGAWMDEEGVSWHARSSFACRVAAV